jgi:isopenicillin N synthase-like dioxygenase
MRASHSCQRNTEFREAKTPVFTVLLAVNSGVKVSRFPWRKHKTMDPREQKIGPLVEQTRIREGCFLQLRFHTRVEQVFVPYPDLKKLLISGERRVFQETKEDLQDVEKLLTEHSRDDAWWQQLSRAESEDELRNREEWEAEIVENVRKALAGGFGETIANAAIGLVNTTYGPIYPLFWCASNPFNFVRSQFDVMVRPDRVEECISALAALPPQAQYPLPLSSFEASCLVPSAVFKTVKKKREQRKSQLEHTATCIHMGSIPRVTWRRVFDNVSLTSEECKMFPPNQPLPRINLSQLKDHDADTMVVLLNCLRIVGFACIRVDIPEDLETVRNCLRRSSEFFALPWQQKATAAQRPHQTAGWAQEQYREVFHSYVHFPGQHPPWPSDEICPGYETAITKAMHLFHEICHHSLYAVQKKLDCGSVLTEMLEDWSDPGEGSLKQYWNFSTAMRVMKYFKPQTRSRIMCVSHSDSSLFTLATASLPELQVLRRDNQTWIFPEESATSCADLVIFPGTFLARMTEGYLDATIHRVVRRFNEQRLVIPFFCRPTKVSQCFNVRQPEGYAADDLSDRSKDNQYLEDLDQKNPPKLKETVTEFLDRTVKFLPVFSVHTLENAAETV